MTITSNRWQIAPRLPPEAEKELHGYPPILRQILYNRGYPTHESARRYLEAKSPEGIDPTSMLGIPEAVDRIQYAVQNGERIAIYGDYDVDGVTATALLVLFLRGLEADVFGYIPNRFEEGYGLNKDALKELREKGVDLVITVDCGIRSLEEINFAADIGLDMIISDHHHPGPELPKAQAIIDPKQPADEYPEKELAGVGLAYKLASALGKKMNVRSPRAEDYLDLVALGTVSDLAPLVGENRSLVRDGIRLLQRTNRQGLWSLMGVAKVEPSRVTASDIGFTLGPRLNAAGRLDSALASLQLLLTQDIGEAGHLAQVLDMHNRERQKITREIHHRAEELALDKQVDQYLLFAVHPEFNAGVVGLAASRLVDKYYRPAIVGQVREKNTRASCRSIADFHITEALDMCADLMTHHGGHAAAAGFTVPNENLDELRARLTKIAAEQLEGKDLRPSLFADVEIPLTELKPEMLDYLKWMQPTGYGNPQAIFVSRNLMVTSSRAVGKDEAHLKMRVSDGWLTYDAIAFRQGHWVNKLPNRIDLIYEFELNDFRGRQMLQLKVRDIKPAGG